MPQENAQEIRVLVVSDLHLFARRSDGLNQIGSLRERLLETDVLVLNGDIFDFRWSTHSEHAHSIREAIQWLREFSHSIPNCLVLCWLLLWLNTCSNQHQQRQSDASS